MCSLALNRCSVKQLTNAGADVNAQYDGGGGGGGESGGSTLRAAAHHGNTAVVKSLLRSEANVNTQKGYSAQLYKRRNRNRWRNVKRWFDFCWRQRRILQRIFLKEKWKVLFSSFFFSLFFFFSFHSFPRHYRLSSHFFFSFLKSCFFGLIAMYSELAICRLYFFHEGALSFRIA